MCGVFGIYGHPEAANIDLPRPARAPAPRAGVGGHRHERRRAALRAPRDGPRAGRASRRSSSRSCPGRVAIGHVRYSTAGGSHLKNAQPFAVDYARGSLAVCHNGNLTNADELRAELEARGLDLPERQRHRGDRPPRRDEQGERRRGPHRRRARAACKGAYSLLFLTEDAIIAVRDPMGIRPLCLGILPVDEGRARRRERAVRVRPHRRRVRARRRAGRDGRHRRRGHPQRRARSTKAPPQRVHLRVRLLRAARLASSTGAASTRCARRSGAALAEEHPVDADVVIPVPDSGVPAAIGYAAAREHPLRDGPHPLALRRPHVHRAAAVDPPLRRAPEAQPGRAGPRAASASSSSTTRSSAARRRARSSRWCATRARARSTCASRARRRSGPATTASTRRRARELIASSHSVDEIARYVTADSLGYLSLEGMLAAVAARRAATASATPASRGSTRSRSRRRNQAHDAPRRRLSHRTVSRRV